MLHFSSLHLSITSQLLSCLCGYASKHLFLLVVL